MAKRVRDTRNVPSILCIGGVDPSGGAGLAADAGAAVRAGVHAALVASVITVQDGRRFSGMAVMPDRLVEAQIRAAVSACRPRAVKTGALGSTRAVRLVARCLDDLDLGTLVVDPVLVSTSQGTLLDRAGVKALSDLLLPRAAIATPNLAEAEVLSGVRVRSLDAMRRAGERILALGPSAVLVKGGHLSGDPVDLLLHRNGEVVFTRRRVLGVSKARGTGCRLATAIACGLARGFPIERAAAAALVQVEEALSRSRRTAAGMMVPGDAARP